MAAQINTHTLIALSAQFTEVQIQVDVEGLRAMIEHARVDTMESRSVKLVVFIQAAVTFFDTNLFVYLFDDSDARKQATAQVLVSRALAVGNASISFQVVQETLHVLTRKFARRVTTDVAQEILRTSLLPFWHVQPSPALYTRALDLQERYAFERVVGGSAGPYCGRRRGAADARDAGAKASCGGARSD